MTEQHQDPGIDWPALLQRIKMEIDDLGDNEREWLRGRVETIASLQLALNELFINAGGNESCAECDGACCGCGRHHITLTNLLAFILEGDPPPAPDFNRTCPFLGDKGCSLPVARRPYNCITFFCETLEDRLSSAQCARLRALDRQLRDAYQELAERYRAASLRGLWVALQWVGDGPLLRSTGKAVLE